MVKYRLGDIEFLPSEFKDNTAFFYLMIMNDTDILRDPYPHYNWISYLGKLNIW